MSFRSVSSPGRRFAWGQWYAAVDALLQRMKSEYGETLLGMRLSGQKPAFLMDDSADPQRFQGRMKEPPPERIMVPMDPRDAAGKKDLRAQPPDPSSMEAADASRHNDPAPVSWFSKVIAILRGF